MPLTSSPIEHLVDRQWSTITKERLVSSINKSWDLWLLCVAVGLGNYHLIIGSPSNPLMFTYEGIATGQWWRILTFSFVHLSFYHLLLDAGAFFLLYTSLEAKRPLIKGLSMTICGLTSLVASLVFSPLVGEVGLCGLSGIAHGLMVITGFESIQNRETRLAGWMTLSIVLMKSLFEAITGNVFLEFLHFGLCGTPVAVSHLGGVVGGTIVSLVALHFRKGVAETNRTNSV